MNFISNRERITEYILNNIPNAPKQIIRKGIRCFSSFKPKSLRPGLPSSITIDPVNVCNLKCPLCPTGLKKINYKPGVMSFDTFKLILDQLPSLKHLCLFNWGEPFLNPSLFKMIGYAKEKNLRVIVHSHFSFKTDDDFFLNILESRLDTLTISLDGASQESYSKYKVGGDFDLVLSNIKRLVTVKKEQRCKKPTVIWKFIINRFNEEEIPYARKLSKRLGVKFETASLGLSDDLPGFDLKSSIEQRKKYWLPQRNKYRHPYYRHEYKKPLNARPCNMLFETAVINFDGKVFPCCWVTDEKHIFGDLKKESFEDIWHNSIYQYSRSLFCTDNYNGSKEKSVCSICENYKKVK